jgi:hypothetical protein
MSWKTLAPVTALAVLVIAVGVFDLRPRIEAQQGAGSAAAGKCSVIDTDGTNLIVVDNAKNTVYFYTVEPGKEPGEDLLLRGSIDLSRVGEPVLKGKKMSK